MQVVILCGGKGTRSYPFTEYYPKPMMPIDGIPILVHLMRSYARHGITRFILAAGYRMEILHDYFRGRFREWEVRIVDTGADSDTGERIRRCRAHLDGRFHATYGDGLSDVNLQSLSETHAAHGGLATVTTVPLRSQYGAVRFDENGRVNAFEEKPIIDGQWINAGFFVFESSVFDNWDGENLERDVLPGLVRRGQLYAYRHRGFFRSMDTSKEQADLEKLHASGQAPWSDQAVGKEEAGR